MIAKVISKIDIIPDFPNQGVMFRDISRVMEDSELDNFVVEKMAELCSDLDFDVFAGLDSRGFLFKSIANRMNKGFVMVRKSGKIPSRTNIGYSTEYSNANICLGVNSLLTPKKVIIVDDVLVTGGTLAAAIELIESVGSTIVACLTMIDLIGLDKNPRLNSYRNLSLLRFRFDSNAKSPEIQEYIPLKPCILAETVVFFHPSMEEIGLSIISKTEFSRRGCIRWGKFPDGTPNIEFENEETLRNQKIIYVMSCSVDLLDQISMMQVLPQQDIYSLDVYLPFFHVGTMERVNEYGPNQLATADTLARLLSSNIPLTQTGRVKLHIYDLHTLQNRFYFDRNILVIMETGINLLERQLTNEVIVFPDDGAAKRFSSFFKNFTCLTCSKKRIGDRRIISIENCPTMMNYEHAIIIDDLVQTGGTLEECRKALIEKGFEKVSAYVTHVVFPNSAERKMLNFHKFYFTNSNPSVSSRLTRDPFIKLNLADDICKERNYHPKENITIYVASLSEIKLEAVHLAFSRKYNCKIIGVNVPSDVSEQPIGNETVTGALNRIGHLKNTVENYDYLISMENGIELVNEKSFDFCQIAIKKFGEEDSLFRCQKIVEFPREFYDLAIKKGKTVGELLHESYGYKKDDWHKHFSVWDRTEIIASELTQYVNSKFRDDRYNW